MSPLTHMHHCRGTQQAVYSTGGHYPYDLGSCQPNMKIQVAEQELSLNLLGHHLLASCHIKGIPTSWHGTALQLGEKKEAPCPEIG